MKLRIAIPRRTLLGITGLFLLLGGGAGTAAYFGLLPLPLGAEVELRGSIDEVPPKHGEKTADGTVAEGHGIESGSKQVGADGEHAGVAGEHGREAGAPDVTYDLPPRYNFTKAVRNLMAAQTAAALGSSEHVGTQREAISKIQIELQTFNPKKAHPQELEALGIYLLSGGDPRGLGGLIDDIPPVSPLKKILRGAHSYVVGENEKARKLLLDIELSAISPALASRISLARAALVDPADFQAQAAALKRAASFTPGTLVEEAAYRRLVAVAIKSGNLGSFVRSTRHYIRRFPKSHYVNEFLQSYAQGLLHFEEMRRPPPRQDITSLLHALPDEFARTWVLELGKQSAKRGQRDLCLYVSAGKFSHYLRDVTDLQRQKLYALACNVVEDPEGSKDGLRVLSAEGLPPDDAALLQDALRLSEAMLGQGQDPAGDRTAGPELPDAETLSSLVSAAQELQLSERLLKEALQ